jgi:hypothetical protein
MEANHRTLPLACWHQTLHCTVRVLKRGHYPDTVWVRLPDDNETEVYEKDLHTHDELAQSQKRQTDRA